ncbi:MAG TPA: MarR family transcriptional regulator [Thermoleophilaceae bacterium]
MASRRSKSREALLIELGEATRVYQRSVDALDELAGKVMGVNRTDQRVLDLLEQHGRMTAGEIAAGAGVTSGAVTGIIDRLEQHGYARRVRDAADRRKVLVEPAPLLKETAERLYSGMGVRGEEALRPYTDDELRSILRFLRDAARITDEHAADLRAQ